MPRFAGAGAPEGEFACTQNGKSFLQVRVWPSIRRRVIEHRSRELGAGSRQFPGLMGHDWQDKLDYVATEAERIVESELKMTKLSSFGRGALDFGGRGDVPTQRNPMELVTIRGVTKRKRQPRSDQ